MRVQPIRVDALVLFLQCGSRYVDILCRLFQRIFQLIGLRNRIKNKKQVVRGMVQDNSSISGTASQFESSQGRKRLTIELHCGKGLAVAVKEKETGFAFVHNAIVRLVECQTIMAFDEGAVVEFVDTLQATDQSPTLVDYAKGEIKPFAAGHTTMKYRYQKLIVADGKSLVNPGAQREKEPKALLRLVH